ncbi:YbaB/EbfC family nucleoid-associated protein [Nonomuraea sp. NPDC050404]|uniref:YbaB/EbfC family nucleoid-associated protein n=1 Tax=Nonomuraea sp. NPDC050404 TaxID=3155783 RepID=UPI0033CD3535
MFGHDLNPMDLRPQDVDRATEQARGVEAALAEADGLLAELTGTGRSRSGHVSAVVNAEGRVLDVTVGERALREGAIALCEDIFTAVGNAQEDVQRQAEALLRGHLRQAVPDLAMDPVELRQRLERLLD